MVDYSTHRKVDKTMITTLELRAKLIEAKALTGLDLSVNHMYYRSRLPYTLTLESETLTRGTKDDIYNYLDAIMTGYKAATTQHNDA